MKAQRKDMCTQLLERYNAELEGEAFLQGILTANESWVHHYDPGCKAQAMEYRHKTSPSPKKFKKYLKGHHCDNDEEVIADVRRWCRGKSSEFFADGMSQLVKRWRLFSFLINLVHTGDVILLGFRRARMSQSRLARHCATTTPGHRDVVNEDWFLYTASLQQGDLRFSGTPSGQGSGGGARIRNRRVPTDLRADFANHCTTDASVSKQK
ncbi:histone-lysine N-methyltransferase SETMAR [Plakobranchus ocellatus]|uniref:Histone-lysine N-methyltransferase SETMAR n=1 Tax=Plakobranchus ocellatus TaxID=259542 RepID=A0AAV4D7N9_9GAST|nr:histone-lysine N-methyltransferase SETMAR [Plakobranchus ocellatus]